MFNLSRFSTGFVLGFGAGFISRDLLSNGSSVVKPVIKGIMKAGVAILEKTRESVAGVAETLEDLLAEVRTEHFAKESSGTASKRAGATAAASPETAKNVKTATTAGQKS